MIIRSMEKHYEINRITESFVMIIELDKGRTVISDPVPVIAELHSEIEGGLGNRVIFYRDITGHFDKLDHKNGHFMGFVPCPKQDQLPLSALCR